MGLKKTNLSLLKCATFSLVCVWVKSNWLNVTKYEVFFLKASLIYKPFLVVNYTAQIKYHFSFHMFVFFSRDSTKTNNKIHLSKLFLVVLKLEVVLGRRGSEGGLAPPGRHGILGESEEKKVIL